MSFAMSDEERRKRTALRRLGSDAPHCLVCGEADWRCLEVHEPAGRAYDQLGVILCRNCHRKLTDPRDNTPRPANPPLLEQVGQLLLGLAALFALLGAHLKDLGHALLEAAQDCPWPHGWTGSSKGA